MWRVGIYGTRDPLSVPERQGTMEKESYEARKMDEEADGTSPIAVCDPG
jgi:hypothetical protein